MAMPRCLPIALACLTTLAAASSPPGMVVGSVSEPLVAPDGSTYLIFLPRNWTPTSKHPVLLFLHGVGGINNGKGCRNPGLTTQFPLLNPEYAAKVEHIVLVPVAKQKNWRYHLKPSLALVDMAIADLGGDPDRVSIAGQSMGAHGAYLYASQLAPGRFCALVAMCGYVDEEAPITDAVPAAVLESLKSTPLWLFHSEEDDRTPPPGRPQDDAAIVAQAFEAAGNPAVRYTRYPVGKLPPNYIPGHAAFEFAMHDEGLFPWLSAQRRATPPAHAVEPVYVAAGALLVALMASRISCLAWTYSCVALLASTLAFLGLMQSEGGLLDSCRSFSFVGVSFDQCRQIGAAIAQTGAAERGWLMMVVSKARAENCFALGAGLGALYALLFLAKGTKEVAGVHLVHAAWALSVCAVNAQNAGLLNAGAYPVPAEANIDAASQAKLMPFVVITGVQAVLDLTAFFASSARERTATAALKKMKAEAKRK